MLRKTLCINTQYKVDLGLFQKFLEILSKSQAEIQLLNTAQRTVLWGGGEPRPMLQWGTPGLCSSWTSGVIKKKKKDLKFEVRKAAC